MALATHRSNFLLMGMSPVVNWIDWINTAGEFPVESGPVTFVRFPYARRWYIGNAFSIWPALRPYWWHDELWGDPNWRRLAIGGTIVRGLLGESVVVRHGGDCLQEFLDSLTGIIRAGGDDRPERLDLPSFDQAGFGIREDSRGRRADGSDYNYALFRDGLALVGDPFRPRKIETRRWSPKEGFGGVRELAAMHRRPERAPYRPRRLRRAAPLYAPQASIIVPRGNGVFSFDHSWYGAAVWLYGPGSGRSNWTRVGIWNALPKTIASPDDNIVTWSSRRRACIGMIRRKWSMSSGFCRRWLMKLAHWLIMVWLISLGRWLAMMSDSPNLRPSFAMRS
ncbi:hypothetical protein ACVDG5_035355 [Mesorhizobium sp. ORM6]